MSAATERGLPLRAKLISRIAKKVGTKYEEMSDKEQEFLDKSVDAMIRSSMLTQTAVDEVAKIMKQRFVPPPPKQTFVPPTPPSGPKSPFMAKMETPSASDGSRKPNPRLAALNRQSRLERDAQWAEKVDEELEKFKYDQSVAAAKARAKRDEQKRFLESQMEISKLQKEAQAKQALVETQKALTATQRNLELEKAEQEEKRRKIMEERNVREGMLKNHLEQRRLEDQARLEAEKRYLESIMQENEEKRRRELDHRLRTRAELQKSLAENTERDRQNRYKLEEQKRKEAQEIEERKRIQELRERAAREEIQRKSLKGLVNNQRQEVIAQQFVERRDQEEAKIRERELRNLERHQQDEAKLDAIAYARLQKKRELKEDLTRTLENQMAEHEHLKTQRQNEYRHYRDGVSNNLLLGVASNENEKERTLMQRRALQQALDTQIAEREIKQRQEVQIKIR